MSDTQRTCPSCGKPLAADAPQNLCPECLMRAGLGSAGGTEHGGLPGFVPPTVLEIARLFPQFEVLELIGAGGMGAVYKARQPTLDRLVALKVLPPRTVADPGFAERFTREARALAKLSHPNIVTVHDFGQADGLHYLVMEYVDGPNLRQLERAGRLSPGEALTIIPQICEALQFAHDEGIVHRDIKPENVLLDKKGRVKIADFGLAKILGRQPDLSLTGARDVMGTPHYMAPEQVEHPQAVDHRADIYSLGVVFYEMLTGELPLGKFAPPSRKVQVDVRLDEVVLHALEKEPYRRYQQASQVKSDVEHIAAHAGTEPPAPPVWPGGPPASEGFSLPPAEALHKQIKAPAIALLVTGILSWVLLPFFLAFFVPAFSRALSPHLEHHTPGLGVPVPALVPTIIVLAAPFASCSFLIYAGLKMMRFERYAVAVSASLVAMLFTPTNCVGFPIGVWALVVLTRSEIREEFRRRKLAAKPGKPNRGQAARLDPPGAGSPLQ